MPTAFRWLACMALLLVVASHSQAQDPETYKDEKFGFSFTHTGLKESAYQLDVTVLDAFVDAEPGSYLEIEWLKPRDHDQYVSGMKLGMEMLDVKPESTEEVTVSGRKFTRIDYKSAEGGDGTKALHLIEKADKDNWFFGVTCIATGENADADFKSLVKAAESFSLDMKKAPSKPKDKHHVDQQYGFHIKLEGFKNEAKPWKEALIRLWTLYEGESHLGTFMVRMVRREGKIEDQMKELREIFTDAGRKIVSEESVEVNGLKGVRMKVEFEQRGVKNVHDQYMLYGDTVIWNAIAAYRPAQSEGKESAIVDAMTSFKPPKSKK